MALRAIIGIAIGAAVGGLAGYLVKCSSGGCVFAKNPGRGALVGALAGLLFALYFGPTGWRPLGRSNVVPLTGDMFDETIAAGGPLVVDFYTDDCPACAKLAPRLEKLADAYKGSVVVARVNAGAEKALAGRYNIRAVPTLVFFAGGKSVGSVKGAISYSALKKQVESLIEEHAAKAQEGAAGPERPAEPTSEEPSPPDEPSLQ